MAVFQNLDRLHYPPRPANARAKLEKILCALVEDYGAEKIIAFGSAVRGGVTEHSDIDLCVLREHPPGCTRPRWEGQMAVAKTDARIPYDLLVLNPAQWREQNARPFGVYDEVTQHGVSVYDFSDRYVDIAPDPDPDRTEIAALHADVVRLIDELFPPPPSPAAAP